MMRDVLKGLQPVLDLVPEGGGSPELADELRKAAVAVASRATDADDCARLLEMLGLHRGKRTEVA